MNDFVSYPVGSLPEPAVMATNDVQNLTSIHHLLYRLGLTENYKGFTQMSCALSLCVRDPQCLVLVTKRLYPDTAKQCGTSKYAVERNIRTAISIIWENNRPLLETLARRELRYRPYAAQFLAILCHYLLYADQLLP